MLSKIARDWAIYIKHTIYIIYLSYQTIAKFMFISKLYHLITDKKLIKVWIYSLALIVVMLIALPYFPTNSLTQLIEYTLYLSPRWLLLTLLIPAVIFWRKLNKTHRIFSAFYLLFFINFQDVNLNLPSSTQSQDAIKLVSLNMGGGSNSQYLKSLIYQEDPDIFLFQETYVARIDKIFADPWTFQCHSGLCIASKFTFKMVNQYSRRIFNGWGNFAVAYELDIHGKELPLMNVHLETPRPIISGLLHSSVNWREIKLFRENKSLESSLISAWASSQQQFIMAGDFNMTANESLYRDYFSSFQNALDTRGLGLNYTKYTAWHGVRIDHVLTSNNMTIETSEVMPSLGGDHRAVVTTFTLP